MPRRSKEYPKLRSRTSFLQLGYAFMSSLTLFSVGLAVGFSAVTVPQLYKGEGGFVITIEDASWISSVINLFSPVGCLVGGYLVDNYGRRFMLIFCEIPMAIGWVYTSIAKSAVDVIIGRIITGVGIGMTIGPPRIYITEISLPNMRGMLGALITVALSLGIIVQAILGSHLNWKTLCYFSACYTSTLSVVNVFLPETPYYTLLKKSPEETKENLKKFRSESYNLNDEMVQLLEFKRIYELRKIGQIPPIQIQGLCYILALTILMLTFKQKFKALLEKSACKPFWIIVPFILITQLSGVSVVLYYTVEILQDSKSSVDAYSGNIMLAFTKLIFGIIASLLIFKVGRRPLILFSCIGVGCICLLLGLYLIYVTQNSIFPQLCFMAYVGCATVGFHSLILLVMYELYPLQIRGLLGGITISIFQLLTFAVNTAFPYVKRQIGLPATIVCFGINALLGSIFLYFRLPETKGLSLEDIEQKFNERRLSLIPSDPGARSAIRLMSMKIQDLVVGSLGGEVGKKVVQSPKRW